MTIESFLFYGFGAAALVGALASLLQVRSQAAALVGLAAALVALSGLLALLDAHLIAVLMVLVHGGAVLVLALFSIMLVDPRADAFGPFDPARVVVKGAGVAVTIGLGAVLAGTLTGSLPALEAVPEGFGGHRELGRQLFTGYLVPVETVGLLLLAALVGSAFLARRRLDG